MLKFLRNHIFPYWRSIIVVSVPLLLLPLPIIAGTKEASCGYIILIMAIYWMTEALPLPITSLIPVVAFPLFGILDTGDVCMAYMKETNMMFIGGLILALGIEFCNLHKRVALAVLLLVGAKPRWLMVGFMGTTAFLSMWISNTATTAMMVPIVEAVVAELYKDEDEKSVGSSHITVAISNDSIQELVPDSLSFKDNSEKSSSSPLSQAAKDTEKERRRKVRVGVMMCIAYASNIGGTGSLIGSSPQLALKGIVQETFGTTELNFASWMAFNIPGVIINLFFAWLWIQYLFIGFKGQSSDQDREKEVKKMIRRKFRDLGPMTFHEGAVLILFIICVMLWFFRDPGFVPGWAHFIEDAHVDDATAVMIIVLFLFSIPAKPAFWCLRPLGETGPEKPSPALLDWKYVQDRLPWGIVLLLGGGFALSDATQASGLSDWIGQQLIVLKVLPPFVIMLIICIITATITEIASNTATANILLPILADTAVSIGVNPLYLMVPATVTCSYAFMLPVATPPNAIVFSAAKMNPVEMMKAGWFMNLVCVVVICVLMETWGSVIFNSNEFPAWANTTLTDKNENQCNITELLSTTMADVSIWGN
ncbi:solute carrier family 13 member 5-like [Daphnia pulex]|uniref:solute carrier family 13 member 5-like n=1 Tax=Daphnia pulex TaxID=6669 RepID=UPI001EE06BFD|nr:solute carrier family 13 member 5-like [Daphnia pulex]